MRTFSSIIAILVSSASSLMASDPAGVIVYKDSPQGRDDFASVVEYSSYESFARVTNYVPASGGGPVRIENNRFVTAVDYPKLEQATIVSPQQIDAFNQSVAQLQQVLDKYLNARGVLADDMARFQTAAQMFTQGKVLVSGEWKLRSEYEATMSSPGQSLASISIGGRTFKNARLTSIAGAQIKFMHSGGVGSANVGDLTDEQIELFNSTSPDVRIDREQMAAAPDPPEKMAESVSEPSPLENRERAVLPGQFFTNSLEAKLDSVDQEFLPVISRLEKELKEAEAKLPEGVKYEDLLKQLPPEITFLVKRKLDPVEFGYGAPSLGRNFELYEIETNPRFNPTLALLETSYTSFQSDGLATLPLKRLPPAKVTMENGFDREVEVFQEIPKNDLAMDRLEPFHAVSRLKDELEDEQEKLEKKKNALRSGDLELQEKVFPPRIYVSNSLKRSGFTIQVGRITLPEELDYDSMLIDLRSRDYDKLFEKYTSKNRSDYLTERSYSSMISQIAKTKVAIGIVAPGARVGERGSLGTQSQDSSADERVVKVLVIGRQDTSFNRLSGFSSLGIKYSLLNQSKVELHPDGNGFLVTAEPFESEIYFFQSFRNGWRSEESKRHDIAELLKIWNDEYDEKAKDLFKRFELGNFNEAGLEHERQRLAEEFRNQIRQALSAL